MAKLDVFQDCANYLKKIQLGKNTTSVFSRYPLHNVHQN